MALTPRGSTNEPDMEKDSAEFLEQSISGIPPYRGESGWDEDKTVLDNVEIVMEEFIKVMYSTKHSEMEKMTIAVASMALIKGAIERRDKNKDK